MTALTTTIARPHAAPAPLARLLLVDDDPMVARSLSEFLRLEGYQVDCAVDGPRALEMLATSRYNLILTDVNTPRTNGLEFLRALRQQHPDVVVLVITAYGTIENAVERGGSKCTGKAFNII